jgi:thiol:disulfide interchange protein DsbA
MPRIASLLLGFALLALSATTCAAERYLEGKHYKPVSPPAATAGGDGVEVVELFWYGCGHCFSFEPILSAWLDKKPEGVDFRRVPAVFAENWVPHARAFYAAAALGASDKLHRPLFDAIHVDARKLFNEDSLIAFAAEVGIPEADFRQAYDGFAIDGKVKQAMLATRDYQIDGVPSLIVAGKYRVTASMAGSQAEMLKVVEFLVAKERNR